MSGPVEVKKESVSVSWVEGVQLAVEIRNHRLLLDQPEDEGGQDRGITPVEMFVGSLAGCIAYFAARFCQRHAIPADGLRVTMHWDYAERPHRIGEMTAYVDLPAPLDPPMKRRLQQVLEGCTIHQTLADPPKVSVVINETSNPNGERHSRP
ncbi:MAG TPA: OsmC family protein [Nitrospiria bacterium]|nr:OsmC family protein [Nitrospiria bacterium]